MVTTRGRRSAPATAADEDSLSRSRRAKQTTSSAQAEPETGEIGETIGSRLRKRRFAAAETTLPSENRSSRSKRQKRPLSPVEASPVPIPTKPASNTKTPGRKARVPDPSEITNHYEIIEQRSSTDVEELDETVEQLIQEAEASLTTRREAEPLPNRLASIESLPLVVQFKELLPLGKTLNIDVDEQTSVLQEIVEHCEKLERYEKLGKNAEINGLPTMGADGGLQAKALLVLGNLTTQLLHIFATYTYLDLVTVVAEPDSDAGKIFRAYNSLFERTKKVYATKDAFISLPETNGLPSAAVKQARNANLATFVISCFGSGTVGFYHLNEYFMEIFASDGSRILKQQASLFLELKTQAYLSAMSNNERVKSVVLDELFPKDLEQRIQNRKPGARPLHQSESEFVERARNRRRHLEGEVDNTKALDSLKERYKWESFLADLAGYISKNFEGLVGQPASVMERLCGRVVSLRPPPPEDQISSRQQTPPATPPRSPPLERTSSQYSPPQPPAHPSPIAAPPPPPPPPSYYQAPPPLAQFHTHRPPMGPNGIHQPSPYHAEDIAAKAQRAAHEALQSYLPNGQPVMAGRPVPPAHYPSPYGPPPPQNMHSPPADYRPLHTAGAGPPNHQGPPHMGPPVGHPQHHPHGLPAPAQHPFYDPQSHGASTHQPPPHMQMHQPPPHGPPSSRHIHAQDGQFVYHQFPPPPPAGYPPHAGSYYRPGPYPPNAPPPLPNMMYSIPHGQSLPTAVLYEKARAVASTKSSSSGRTGKGSTVSQRRPWSTEEEQALMAGLDAVKGPHWSQILALYGAGGTHGEALRDRTQVQLKDKARNLKLFFLKSGIETPYYLGLVTGELKSRAPSHVKADSEGNESPSTPDRISTIIDFGPEPMLALQPPISATDNVSKAQQPSAQNGTYASPYAAIPAPPAGMPQATTTPPAVSSPTTVDDNIDPAISQASGPSPLIQDLAKSAAEEAARNIAATNGSAREGILEPAAATNLAGTLGGEAASGPPPGTGPGSVPDPPSKASGAQNGAVAAEAPPSNSAEQNGAQASLT